MQNAQILNLGAAPSRNPETASAPRVEGEFHSDDLIEQTRSDVRRMRLFVEQQEEEQERRTRIFSVILGALAVFFLVALWFAYPTIRDQKSAVVEMLGLKNVAKGLGDRMDLAEANLARVAASEPALEDRAHGRQ